MTVLEAAWATIKEKGVAVSNRQGDSGIVESQGTVGIGEWSAVVWVSVEELASRHPGLADQITRETGVRYFFAALVEGQGEEAELVTWGHDEGAHSGTDRVMERWQSATSG